MSLYIIELIIHLQLSYDETKRWINITL